MWVEKIKMEVFIDPKGIEKRQKYDIFGRVLEVQDPDRSTIRYAYDDAGNVIWKEDGNGRVTMRTYDALNRVLTGRGKREARDAGDVSL